MKVPVISLSYIEGERPRDKWDFGMLERLFAGQLWNAVRGYEFEHFEATSLEGFSGQGAVVIFPAGIHRDQIDRLNADLEHLDWVILVLTADEGSLFDVNRVEHPRIRFWVMTPRPGREYPPGTRFIGEGWKSDTPEILAELDHGARSRNVWFSGQVTHARRKSMVEALEAYEPLITEGFAQGLDRREYLRMLADTKIAPAPAGPVTPDSFRLYEALEAGALPIADAICPDYDAVDYWEMVAPGYNFPTITKWLQVGHLAVDLLAKWPDNANHVWAWWQQHKRTMVYWMVDDLGSFVDTEYGGMRDEFTILMSTSPIPSHPSTHIVERTISMVRELLPDCEIILGIDGVRAQQEHYRKDYEEYTRRVLELCNDTWTNVVPMVFEQHQHQSGMARAAMDLVRTPFIFYVEGDLPPIGPIPFEGIAQCLADETADVIRLTLNTALEPLHSHLMMDNGMMQNPHGVPMVKTVQWSQQPHFARAEYYRSILRDHFTEFPRFIESVMHAVCATDWYDNGEIAWGRNRIWIYTPEGNMCRVVHLDGRQGDPTFDED